MDDAATIKDDVHAQLRDALALIAARDAQLTERDVALREHERLLAFRDAKIAALTAHIALLNRHRFGQRSEQFDPGQRLLFGETLEEDAAAAETELDALTPATARPRRQSKRLPLPEQVMIPMFSQHLDDEQRFTPNEIHLGSAKTMLDELARWAAALQGMRAGAA